MTVFVEPTSYRRQNGMFVPRALVFTHWGDQTRVLPWEWLNQEFDTEEGADGYAVAQAKMFIDKKLNNKKIATFP